jgi:hypothetical protein
MVHDCFEFHQTCLNSYSTLNSLNIKTEFVAKVEAEDSSVDTNPSIFELYPMEVTCEVDNDDTKTDDHLKTAKSTEFDGSTGKVKINGRMWRACSVCGKVVRNLQDHLRVHNQEKPFTCTHCPKTFSDRSNLKKHLQLHEKYRHYGKFSDVENYRIKGRQYRQCNICGKIIKNLKEHLITHTNVKNFQCHHCERLFGDKSNMAKHMRIHFNIRNYICQICARTFIIASTLRKHMKIHRDKVQCTVAGCPRMFKNENFLTIHLRTHTLDSAYTCEICKRVFATESALIRLYIYSFIPDF